MDLDDDGEDFKDFLNIFQAKVGGKRCVVELAGADPQVPSRVLLRWKRSVSYSQLAAEVGQDL